MSCRSPIHRLDPRARVLTAFGLAIIIAISNTPRAVMAGLVLSAISVLAARTSLPTLIRRLMGVNVFMLFLLIVLPFSGGGMPIFSLGPLTYSTKGLKLALLITGKANAIVPLFVAYLGSMEVETLGHALSHMHFPKKLAHLLLFTVRYVEVLRDEASRLHRAMRVRCFHPRFCMHTYRTFGNFAGMMLVNSFERSDRILSAMKCRGFTGTFFLLHHFHWHRRDSAFMVLSGVAALALIVLECYHG